MQLNGIAENEELRPDNPDAEDVVAVADEDKKAIEEKAVPEEEEETEEAVETEPPVEDDAGEQTVGEEEEAETPETEPVEELDELEKDLELRVNDPSRPNLLWYIVHALTGHEQKVKAGIERGVADRGMEDLIVEVLVPLEEVTTQTKKGKKTRKKIFFPGYVMVRMEITDTSWGLVRETASVTGFVSAAGNKPSPLTEDEVRIILDQIAGRKPRLKYEVEIDEGEPVRITSGPFAGFTGIVEEVIPDRGKVKVQVTVFGRATTVELELSQVDKAV